MAEEKAERKGKPKGRREGRKRTGEIKESGKAKKPEPEEKIEEKIEVIEEPPSEEVVEKIAEKPFALEAWKPKTGLGMKVKNNEITDIDFILDRGLRILESEIVDTLLPNLKTELMMIGQAKGKFGGGQRRVFKQTQKKTPEGNKPHFAAFAIVGNEDGYVGAGYGKAKETVPAREKAIRNAKLAIIKIRRGCGSWQCGCENPHSIPFAVKGICGSVRITLMPAPKGKGLCVTEECQKILALAGIKDIWSKTRGQVRSTINLVNACMSALRQLTETKTGAVGARKANFVEGKANKQETLAENFVETETPKNEESGGAKE